MCGKVRCSEDTADAYFHSKNTAKNDSPAEVVIKTEDPLGQHTDKDITMEELDSEFQDMLDGLEDQIKEDQDELPAQTNVEEDKGDKTENFTLELADDSVDDESELEDGELKIDLKIDHVGPATDCLRNKGESDCKVNKAECFQYFSLLYNFMILSPR